MRALLLALLLLAPLALADHVYSHRYVVDGRLVGSDGLPLPARAVRLLAENVSLLQPCREAQQRSVTDEWGDFRFCFHAHGLPRGARVGAQSGNASVVVALDRALRRTTVALEEPNETGAAPARWNGTYRVEGRVWRAGEAELEGVPVQGVALADAPVNLTIRAEDGAESRFATRTDGYGDYDLVVETDVDPALVTLTVESMGRGFPAALDARSHRTSAPIVLPSEGAALRETPATRAPGSVSPPVSALMVLAVAAGLALSVGVARRKG